MTNGNISPLRRRMTEGMTVPGFTAGRQARIAQGRKDRTAMLSEHLLRLLAGLVAGGARARRDAAWRPRFFLHLRVLSSLFCRLFLEKLVAAHEAGRRRFLGERAHLADGQAFAHFLDPLRDIDWVVYAKPPFGGPEAVLAYLSRDPPRGFLP